MRRQLVITFLILLFGWAILPQIAAASRPNIILIMSDDQRQDDMAVMKKTNQLLTRTGTTFANSYVSYSLCCPSRTTLLTGQYMHNHGITWNFWPEGGYFKFKHSTNNGGWGNTLPSWLQRSGYHTGLIGKYLNQYGEDDPSTPSKDPHPREIPPGWSEWMGGVDPTTYSYFGYTLNVNGKLRRYGRCERVDLKGHVSSNPLDGCKTTSQTGKDGSEYQTDVLSSYAENFINKNSKSKKPYFLWVTPTAPHTTTSTGENEGLPAIPPKRYKKTFSSSLLPHWPSLDEADVSDKPFLQGFFHWFPRMGAGGIAMATAHYRGRRGAVLGLDDMVARVKAAVNKSPDKNNTIIIYTSDNGWLLGEHRIVAQKFFGFDESIRVPLIISGPGFNHRGGYKISSPAVNADLAPTILKAAGTRAGRPMDGIALQNLRSNPGAWAERSVAIETGPNPRGPFYSGLHSKRWHLEIITGGGLPDRYELYDMLKDPHQMDAVTADPRYAGILSQLISMTHTLGACKGRQCDMTTKLVAP